jgi:hypothetical protein
MCGWANKVLDNGIFHPLALTSPLRTPIANVTPRETGAFSFVRQQLTRQERVFSFMDLKTAKRKYDSHRANAGKRGIPFELTFDEWLGVWGDKLDRRGNHKDELVMCRNGDRGAYAVGNVRIASPAENAQDRKCYHASNYRWSGLCDTRMPEWHGQDSGDPEKWGIRFANEPEPEEEY